MTARHTVDSITSDELDQLYDDLDRADEVIGDLNEALIDRAKLLDEVLRHFVHKGHPGEPCLSTGWVSVKTVERWRSALYAPATIEATNADEPARSTANNPEQPHA